MRFVYILGVAGFLSYSAMAETVVLAECEDKITRAETAGETSVYDECGFNDIETAWNKWAGWVSQKQYKRALYELCVRYPDHPYSDLYCEKSANLGYGPAIAEQGHRLMAQNFSKLAVEHYTRALQTRSLSDEQEGKVAEQLGLYHLDELGGAYAPAKGIAFLDEASKKRSAAANNMLGYLSYSGEFGVRKSEKESFKYIWRAILLGCPAAEENLGLFHLGKSKKLTYQTVVKYMRASAFSCQPTSPVNTQSLVKPAGCVCEEAFEIQERHKNKPYYLTAVMGDTASLRDTSGATHSVQLKQKLSDGYFVTDIRPTAVILEKAGVRMVLNLVRNMDCLDFCEKMRLTDGTVEDVKIKPYRLSFTPQECQHLMHYAPLLVDVSKPYVGKTECAGDSGSVDDELLRLMREGEENEETTNMVLPLPARLMQPFTPGVQGQIGVVKNEESRGPQPQVLFPVKKQPKGLPKKKIQFRVGGGISQNNKK